MAENFSLADFEDARPFFRLRAGADAARIADGDRAGMVVGHRPKHVAEFIFVLRLHVDDSGNLPEVADIEEAVVGRAVVAGKAGAIHAKGDVEVLQRDIMNDHVVGALQEGRVNGQERLHASHGEAAGEEGGMFFGDADVEVAVRDGALRNGQAPCRWAWQR